MVSIGAMNHEQPEERATVLEILWKNKKSKFNISERETTTSRLFFGKHSGTPVKITCLVIYIYMSFTKKTLDVL